MPVDMDIASEWRYRNPVVCRARPRHRHHAVGRDRRHAGGDAPGARARREGAGDARTSSARRPRATPTACSTRAPASRSRSRRRRRSSARSPRCTCWRCAWRSCAGRWRPSGSPSSSRTSSSCRTHRRAHRPLDGRSRPPPSATRTRTSSSTSAATSAAPVALEGALKLKEISYIATDAYAGGEMKHGPIALLDESTPVVCVATDMPMLDKMISNMQEVRARGAHVIAVATEGDDRLAAQRRGGHLRPAHRLDAAGAAGGHPAAAVRLLRRAQARAERRPAAQPRQDGHGRVGAAAPRGLR